MKVKVACEVCGRRAKTQYINKGQKVCGKHFSKEMYKCQSYFDDNNVLQNCTCGRCK